MFIATLDIVKATFIEEKLAKLFVKYMRPSQKRQMLAFSVSALGLGVIVISVFMTLTQEYCKGFLISAFLGAILVALGIISNAREADRIRSKGYQ